MTNNVEHDGHLFCAPEAMPNIPGCLSWLDLAEKDRSAVKRSVLTSKGV